MSSFEHKRTVMRSMLVEAQIEGNAEMEITALERLAVLQAGEGLTQDCLATANRAVRLAKEYGDREALVSAQITQASTLHETGRGEEGLKLLCELRESVSDLERPGLMIRIGLEKAACYRQMKQYENAIEQAEAALQTLLDEGEPEFFVELMLLNELAGAHAALEQREQAEHYCREAIDLAGRVGEKHNLGAALVLLGEILCKNGKLSEAIGHLQHALGVYAEENAAESVGDCLLSLGRAYSELPNLPNALAYWRLSGEILSAVGSEWRRAAAHNISLITAMDFGTYWDLSEPEYNVLRGRFGHLMRVAVCGER